MKALENLKRIYQKIADVNPHLNFMNYYSELNKNGQFSALVNDLATFAGYEIGNDIAEFRNEIIRVHIG